MNQEEENAKVKLKEVLAHYCSVLQLPEPPPLACTGPPGSKGRGCLNGLPWAQISSNPASTVRREERPLFSVT